jgi:hypothetical protein
MVSFVDIFGWIHIFSCLCGLFSGFRVYLHLHCYLHLYLHLFSHVLTWLIEVAIKPVGLFDSLLLFLLLSCHYTSYPHTVIPWIIPKLFEFYLQVFFYLAI